ncbi:MAG: tyrosine-type recombinase/integrase [Actinomycetota bacterium]|nr:tyrosine-type recombinase/integrase [Actinomycetota bacterium]
MATNRKKITVKNGISFSGKTYSYVLRVPDPDTGKTKPRWVGGFSTEKQAKIERDKARLALATNTYVIVNQITVGEYLDNWIELHAHQLKPTTLSKYRSYLRLYLKPGLGRIKLQDLKPSHVQTLYGQLLEKPLAPSTVHYAGSILKLALKYAVDVDGLLATNPVSKVQTPKGASVTPDLWNKDELNQFLKVASEHRLGFYFRLSAYTGARRGELCALRWSDFDGALLTISKSRVKAGNQVLELNSTKGGTNGKRTVKVDTDTMELLKAHRRRQFQERMALGECWTDTGYVFVREDGLPIDCHTPTHLFKKLGRLAGLKPIRLHDLGPLRAVELLRLGIPLHVVAHRLGHRDAMVTATIYAHVTDQQIETASETFALAMGSVR